MNEDEKPSDLDVYVVCQALHKAHEKLAEATPLVSQAEALLMTLEEDEAFEKEGMWKKAHAAQQALARTMATNLAAWEVVSNYIKRGRDRAEN